MLVLTVERRKSADDGILVETSDGPVAIRFLSSGGKTARIGVSAPGECDIKRASVGDALDRIHLAEDYGNRYPVVDEEVA